MKTLNELVLKTVQESVTKQSRQATFKANREAKPKTTKMTIKLQDGNMVINIKQLETAMYQETFEFNISYNGNKTKFITNTDGEAIKIVGNSLDVATLFNFLIQDLIIGSKLKALVEEKENQHEKFKLEFKMNHVPIMENGERAKYVALNSDYQVVWFEEKPILKTKWWDEKEGTDKFYGSESDEIEKAIPNKDEWIKLVDWKDSLTEVTP